MSALQPLVALAVVAAALLNPVETAIAVAGLVLVVLIEARMHPRLAAGLGGILGRHGGWKYRLTGSGRSGGLCGRRGGFWRRGRLGGGWSCRRGGRWSGGRWGGRLCRLGGGRRGRAGQTFLAEIGVFLVADRI